MLAYKSFIYLQNHKTGSSFVETLLREFCSETLLYYKKHACLASDPNRFCFVNVRHPYSLYRSLFAYGLDKRGEVYFRLSGGGCAHLYADGPAGFSRWLEFILDPENAWLLADRFSKSASIRMGLVTWRFLRLACPGFESFDGYVDNDFDLNAFYKKNSILSRIVRQEFLRTDLIDIVSGDLKYCFPDQNGIRNWLLRAPNINSSLSRVDLPIENEVLCKIVHKDSFLLTNFYGDDNCNFSTERAE